MSSFDGPLVLLDISVINIGLEPWFSFDDWRDWRDWRDWGDSDASLDFAYGDLDLCQHSSANWATISPWRFSTKFCASSS